MKNLLLLLLAATVTFSPDICQAGTWSEFFKQTVRAVTGKAGQTAARKSTQHVAGHVASSASSQVARAATSKTTATAIRYFGDDALKAGGKLAGSATGLIDDFGRVSAKLSAQNHRRLLMLAPDLQKSGQSAATLGLFSKGRSADEVMEMLWRHRGKIATGAAVTGLVMHGDDVVQATSEHVVAPIAEAAAESIVPAIVEPVRIGAYLVLATGACFMPLVGFKAYRLVRRRPRIA